LPEQENLLFFHIPILADTQESKNPSSGDHIQYTSKAPARGVITADLCDFPGSGPACGSMQGTVVTGRRGMPGPLNHEHSGVNTEPAPVEGFTLLRQTLNRALSHLKNARLSHRPLHHSHACSEYLRPLSSTQRRLLWRWAPPRPPRGLKVSHPLKTSSVFLSLFRLPPRHVQGYA